MYVTQVLIKGFRSLQDVSVKFYPGINVLVGKNNAGKSNIIRALDMVLGEKWPTYHEFGDRDFYRASSDTLPVDNFLIAVCLEGQVNSEMIEDDTGAYIYSLEGAPFWNNHDELMNEPGGQKKYKKGSDLRDFIGGAEKIWLYLLVPRNSKRKERVFAANIHHQDGQWYRMQPVRGAIRDALLTTAFVPSFRDPSNQLRINSFTWYGRLVRHLYEQQTEEQRKNIQEARQLLTQTLDDIFQQATESLRSRLSRAIAHHHISFKAGAFTRDDAYKQITLFVDDGIDTPFYDKGSGIQSALIIALFAQYCEEFHQGGSLLLVEEPEIYLHPQGRRALEAQLVAFARPREEGGERQVILSTHSPEFLRSAPLHQITLVYKPRFATASQVKQFRPDKIDNKTAQKIQREFATKNAEMMFADHVILVEGGEEHLLPILADLYFWENRWLDIRNVSVVPVRGKGKFEIYALILDEFEIPWTLLADLDFLKDEVRKFQNHLSDDDKEAVRQIQEVWRSLSSANIPSGRRIKEKVFNPGTSDWRTLYQEVDIVLNVLTHQGSLVPEQLAAIRSLWDRLKARAGEKNYEAILEACNTEIQTVLTELRKHGIFVLSHGELEDYFTEEAMQLGGGSKEIRALNVAEKIAACSSWEEIQTWLQHIEDFEVFLEHVKRQVEPEANGEVGETESDEYETGEANDGDIASIDWEWEYDPYLDEDVPF